MGGIERTADLTIKAHDQASQTFAAVRANAGDLFKSIGGLGGLAAAGVGGAVGASLAGVAGVARKAMSSVGQWLRESISAAAEYEAANGKLATSLKAVGTAGAQAGGETQTFASMWDQLQGVFDRVKITIGTGLLRMLEELMRIGLALAPIFEAVASVIGAAFEALARAMKPVVDLFLWLMGIDPEKAGQGGKVNATKNAAGASSKSESQTAKGGSVGGGGGRKYGSHGYGTGGDFSTDMQTIYVAPGQTMSEMNALEPILKKIAENTEPRTEWSLKTK